MKFLISPTREALSRARPPVRLFLGFSAVLLLAVGAQRVVAGEYTPAGVFERYLGAGEPGDAMPLAALLEDLHAGAFLYGFLLLMLGALLVVSPVGERARRFLTYGATAACAFDLASPFLVVWLHGASALRLISSALALGLLLANVAVLARAFGRAGPEDA